MKFLYILAFGIFSLAVFHNCQQQTETKETVKKDSIQTEKKQEISKPTLNYAKYTDSTIYPNGGSELSVLMREMYDDSEMIKKAVLEGKLPPDFREKFRYLHAATPTDKDTKTEAYPDMAKAFEDNLNRLYEEKDEKKRIKQFDIVIQNCVACHQSHCPGPIKKIKKLNIKETN
ncbi:hypothetical protein AD998_14015 [bacterium 336/3]|nr:hypothetical protein AD998_14015 [bacterium 336/3]